MKLDPEVWRFCDAGLCSVSGVKEDFAPPPSGMPGPFPVYLRLPYRRDSYFCFKQEAKRNNFLSILSDCIRHQNQGEVTDPQRLFDQYRVGSEGADAGDGPVFTFDCSWGFDLSLIFLPMLLRPLLSVNEDT